jgi:hypothetical protein
MGIRYKLRKMEAPQRGVDLAESLQELLEIPNLKEILQH